jgi:alpha-N-arabinofuranosidase
MKNAFPKVELYACGTNSDQFEWTHKTVPNLVDCCGFAMHRYSERVGDAINFTDEEWDGMLACANRMEEIIERNWNIICAYGRQNDIKLVVDEWGCWHPDGSGPSKGYNLFEQQSTMRDAMVTALTLNIFNNHCDKVRMANVAQLCNNLHALFLASGENCIVTPTYHVFDMYKEHQGAQAIETVVTSNGEFTSSVSVSASVKDGKMLITVGNLSCKDDAEISLEAVGVSLASKGRVTVLANDNIRAHNTFENPDTVAPVTADFDASKPFVIPKAGIVAIEIEVKE